MNTSLRNPTHQIGFRNDNIRKHCESKVQFRAASRSINCGRCKCGKVLTMVALSFFLSFFPFSLGVSHFFSSGVIFQRDFVRRVQC